MKLLYRGSRDGFKAADFHKKCDNIPGTISFIESEHEFVFGGFTNATWEGSKQKRDPRAIVFSVTRLTKYGL